MNELNNCRIRHSMLITAFIPMKHYIECMELGYLGEISPFEKDAVEAMKGIISKVESTCQKYFAKERDLMES